MFSAGLCKTYWCWCSFASIFVAFAEFCKMSLSQGSAQFRFLFLLFVRTFCSRLFAKFVAFSGLGILSLPFLLFVRTFCSRLFAKFFDLRSGLSVSLPLRSVGTLSPSPRESCFCKPRNNLEPCTASLELCRRVWHRRKSEQRIFGLQSTQPNGTLILPSSPKSTRRLVTRLLL